MLKRTALSVLLCVTTFLLVPIFAEENLVKPPIDKPDLDVTFISQTPRYPSIHGKVEYIDHSKPVLTKPEYADIKKFFPENGEKITFTANFMNKGAELSGQVDFVWKIDGKEVARGKAQIPKYGEVAKQKYEWIWQTGAHTVTFELDPSGKIDDFFKANNSKTDRTDALGFHFATNRVTYDRWNANKSFIGSYSFEDWMNWHFDEMNREFEAAVFPSTPNGCLERVRVDTFDVYDKPEDLEKLDRSNYNGYWTFVQENGEGWIKEDMALCHELGHQIGLIDYYLIAFGLFGNTIKDMYGQNVMRGYFFHDGNSNMVSPGAKRWSEVDAAALNRQKGYPRGYYGTYLFDHADNYAIRILDREGKLLPKAKVAMYRHSPGLVKEQEGVTDENGIIHLKNIDVPRYKIPHSPFEVKPTPFGDIKVVGINSILCFHVQANGQEDFPMTDTPWFLVNRWRNMDKKEVVVDIKTTIGSADAPKPPRTVHAFWHEAGTVRIWWTPPESKEALRYNIYISRLPNLWATMALPPECVGKEIEGNEFIYKLQGDPDKSGMIFYVSSVDSKGREGGPSRNMWLPYPPNPDATPHIVYDPPRDRLILTGGSRLSSYKDDVGFQNISWHLPTLSLSLDSFGNLLVTEPAGNMVAHFDINSWMDTYPMNSYGTIADGEKLKAPQDAVADGNGAVVIADTGNGRVVVLSKKSALMAELGGKNDEDKIVEPISVALLPDGRIVAGDAKLGKLITCKVQEDGSATYIATPGEFPKPVDMQVDSDGNLLVLDNALKSVTLFPAPDYSSSKVIVKDLVNPTSMAIGKNGTLIVYDAGRTGLDVLQKFEGVLSRNATYYILSIKDEKLAQYSAVPRSIVEKHLPIIDISKWHIAGPFDNTGMTGFDKVYPPETEKDFDFNREYDGINGKVKWMPLPPKGCPTGDYIYFDSCFYPNEAVCAYAATMIKCEKEQKVSIFTGSDDTITMWINGEKVLSKNVLRMALPDSDKTDVTLKAGENRVLVKVCDKAGGWLLYFRVVDTETGKAIRY